MKIWSKWLFGDRRLPTLVLELDCNHRTQNVGRAWGDAKWLWGKELFEAIFFGELAIYLDPGQRYVKVHAFKTKTASVLFEQHATC